MSAAQPDALILGGSYNAVSVARSLASAGISVSALGNRMSIVRHSRDCARFIDLRTGSEVQERWLDWLERNPQEAVLLPCDDHGLELIARNRAALVAAGYVPFEADDDVVLAMLDKNRTAELARKLGVPAPQTAVVRTAEDLVGLAQGFSYPCALKPVHSHRFAHSYGRSLKAFTANDAAELDDRLGELIELGIEMLVTEIIEGAEDQFHGFYTYIDEHGEALFNLTKRKIRQYPPRFGIGSYHITTDDQDVVEAGLKFVRGVGLRGLANVEFKRDSRDGILKLIECNHRFAAPTELMRVAGADLALFTYNRLTGRPLPSVTAYRPGVRLWLPFQDARAFAGLRRSGDTTTLEWLRSVAHRQHVPVFSWRDPMPTFGYSLARLAQLTRRAGRR